MYKSQSAGEERLSLRTPQREAKGNPSEEPPPTGVAVSELCDTELVGMGNDAAVVKTAGSLEDEGHFPVPTKEGWKAVLVHPC